MLSQSAWPGISSLLFSRVLTVKATWLQVEVDASDKGTLRLAREACPDVLLCEELKHLYTALTRAKNNVVIFDSNTAKRAPFFNYLRRLGMAQYVSRSASLFLTSTCPAQTYVTVNFAKALKTGTQQAYMCPHMHTTHARRCVLLYTCAACICVHQDAATYMSRSCCQGFKDAFGRTHIC